MAMIKSFSVPFCTAKTVSILIAIAVALPAQAALPNGVASGDVSQNSVVLWSRSDTPGDVRFEYTTDPTFATLLGSVERKISDPAIPVKVQLSDLNAATIYHYRATSADGASATGTFSTPAPLGTRNGLRFGVSGDWRGELAPYPAIKNAPNRNLDFFVELGDTIFADSQSPDVPALHAITLSEYRAKHNEVYSSRGGLNAWSNLRASTPVFATIDDHELTNDFSGGADVSTDSRFAANSPGTLINDSTLYNNALQAFQEYNPIANETYVDTGKDPRTDSEIKLYRSRNFGSDAAIMVLDSRSFRDAPLGQLETSNFYATSLTADRTMLGERQIDALKQDLVDSQNEGITWKFVMIPEPIQNLGVNGAADRFEGYGKERTELFQYIDDNNIQNVVFIAADLHGTLVNNLDYQALVPTEDGTPRLISTATNAFEITTGSVGHYKTFGPLNLDLISLVPVDNEGQTLLDVFLSNIGVSNLAEFNTLPLAIQNIALQDLIDSQIEPLGFNPIGLDDSDLIVQQLVGGYTEVNTFGWTEFEIDPITQALLVTTYGIDPYNTRDIADDLNEIIDREPVIVSQFQVQPVPLPAPVWLFMSGLVYLSRFSGLTK